jgi:inorganic pyrophosphatase
MITNAKELLGKEVAVTIDRPLGSAHPKFPQSIYPINYGYIPGTKSPVDNEEIDAYVLGPTSAVKTFTGKVIAIVHRTDDEEKLVVAALPLPATEIENAIHFQEKFYKHTLTLL